MSFPSGKIVRAFNNLFCHFFKWVRTVQKQSSGASTVTAPLRETLNRVKREIKLHYQTVDMTSEKYVSDFGANWNTVEPCSMGDDKDENDLIVKYKDLCVFGTEVTVQDLVDIGCDRSSLTLQLVTLCFIYRFAVRGDAVEKEQAFVECVKLFQSTEDAPDDLAGLVGDEILMNWLHCIVQLNRKMAKEQQEQQEQQTADESSKDNTNGMFDDDALKFLENSKIGQIAKDIANKIDIESLKAQVGENGMPTLDNLLKGGGGAIGDIIQKVGSSISEKIQDGSINQEELMGEAMKLLGSMNKMGGAFGRKGKKGKGSDGGMSDILGSLMGMMGGGGGKKKSRSRYGSTRDRLKRRLEKKAGKPASE
jgi:hypothetical protein